MAALALTGFSAAVGQIVLMRTLIVVFNGNEMSLGILLATWLFWTAAGSSLSSRLALGGKNPRRAAAALECLLAVSLGPTLWALRSSKQVFQAVPGELVGPVPMLLTSLACLSLFCAFSGALFPVAARMTQQECGIAARLAAGRAYLFEAAGSALGGVMASLLLLRFLGAFQIAGIVAVLNVWMAGVLLFRMSRSRFAALLAAAILCGYLLLADAAPVVSLAAQERQWRGFHVAASRDSIYGNLTVTETGSLRSIYDNGVLLANAPDESAAEEAIHYALLEHPAPRKILLIGGGLNGGVAQALKHPTVERIDYVEQDPALIAMARQFFPEQFAPLASDPRVHAHLADGRRYLGTTHSLFDAIVVNVPDPQTAQLNRFYTAEFFRSARQHLAPGGLLALELRSSEETISPALADFLRCIRRTLEEVFPEVVTIPGETLHFVAAIRPGVLSNDPQILLARLRERNLKTQYVSESFIPYRMMPDRMAQVSEQLKPLAATPVNRDFAPVAYFFNMVLWSAQFQNGAAKWFESAALIPFPALLGALLVVLLLAAALPVCARSTEMRARSAAGFCTAATGFTLIALQVFLLLAFQSIYGYVYHQLAILIGLGMAGIALGGWLGLRHVRVRRGTCVPPMAAVQCALGLSVPALVLVVSLPDRVAGLAATWLTAQCAFPVLAALTGMLGGFQFPLATEIYLRSGEGRPGLGALYAIDLLGGCAGALLLSAYLIPVYGFWRSAWLCAAVSLAPVLLAARQD